MAAVPAETDIDWKARALEAERREAEAWQAYHLLAADRADAAHYRERVSGYADSLSWKVTAPLRLVLSLLRRAAGKLKRSFGRR